MVFSSPTFLFLFLPILLGVYFFANSHLKNILLLLASLWFYAWGEGLFVLVMLSSIAGNYLFGILIERYRSRSLGTWVTAVAIIANLALLVSFKYANFIADNLSILATSLGWQSIQLEPIHLPIGISFFTFQAMSYVVDVYRGTNDSQRNPINLALYISLFPQLIAGPIVRYHDVAEQLASRKVTYEDFSYGTRRFVLGFAKKMIIANPLGEAADNIFALPGSEISPEIAWFGIICYTLQIFFDFSGYSDMAIGLGRMFGFRFLENFNYPYISTSIQEFWRRWHISLSNWFRDYLYISLGGNRSGQIRTYFNLVTVFVLCGLWHGASWNFLIWGIIHGAFLVFERLLGSDNISRVPAVIRHCYVLLVVIVAWVFFRLETVPEALAYLNAMFDFSNLPKEHADLGFYYNDSIIFTIVIGCIFATPLLPKLQHYLANSRLVTFIAGRVVTEAAILVGYISIFLLGITFLAAGTYNPFIYFRF